MMLLLMNKIVKGSPVGCIDDVFVLWLLEDKQELSVGGFDNAYFI